MTKAERFEAPLGVPNLDAERLNVKYKRCVKKVKAKGKAKSPHGVCRRAVMGSA